MGIAFHMGKEFTAPHSVRNNSARGNGQCPSMAKDSHNLSVAGYRANKP
jgi:hypothetical protein